MSEEILDPLVDKFDSMTIAQLRKYAKTFHVSLGIHDTADDIKKRIRDKQRRHNMIEEADVSTGPAPGRWRIIIHKDASQGKAGTRPVHINCNGYHCDIPRNVPVDVPEKVVRVLENSVHYVTLDADANDGTRSASTYEAQLSYPFQVVSMTPGDDPSPGHEKSKLGYFLRRKAFLDEFGYWPKNRPQVEQAEKDGLIKKVRPGDKDKLG
jgi:hypothetical protein